MVHAVWRRGLIGLAAFLLLGGAALAAEAGASPPAAADLLFEAPQLDHAAPGAPLVYRYTRRVSDPELGAAFEDRIRLDVAAASGPPGARDVRVDFFTGPRHRAAGPFAAVTGNPVLILFLENHIAELSGILKGNPRYLKSAIRAALRDRAQVTPLAVEIGGRSHAGWRIVVTPFAGDANARRMRGLDTLSYAFDVVPDLPGALSAITVTAEAPGGRLWEEALAYDPQGS